MALLPKIGDKKACKPAAFETGLPYDCPRTVTGTVVWIHPKGRFYVVEVEINGYKWRETLYPEK